MGGREQDPGDIHALDLVEAIKTKGKSCTYLPTFDDVVDYLSVKAQRDDLIITTDVEVYLAAEMLVQRMEEMLVAASHEKV